LHIHTRFNRFFLSLFLLHSFYVINKLLEFFFLSNFK
jgi:hypothetical protein